ncbi:MAG: hypothetical protein ABR543_03395 [Gemmatimonadaceae bacterium]
MTRATRRILLVIGVLVAVLAVLAARWFSGHNQVADESFDVSVPHPTYTSKHPRLVIDEAHHNFHTADGRYRPFAALLSNDGYSVTPNTVKFSSGNLQEADILVIANAMGASMPVLPGASDPAFTPEEADAVRDWVRSGGSLLLVADHEPMGEANTVLADRFGINMTAGRTYDDPNSDWTSGNPGWLIFSRDNRLLADHPITVGRDSSERLTRVQSFGGQSLVGPPGSSPLLMLGKTARNRLPGGADASAEGQLQALAMQYGSGRVVVFGEGAMLTAMLTANGSRKMGMNWPNNDNRQLVLNIMHWLSGAME